MIDKQNLGRRAFLKTSAVTAIGLPLASIANAATPAGNDGFNYEVTRTDAEWRDFLSDSQYTVMRFGLTELPHTSSLATETSEGTYSCQGCELDLYQSVWKVELDIGWVFFSHSIPNSILTAIDGNPPDGMSNGDEDPAAMIEAHCRRCGSHLGHVVYARNQLVHCINGTALKFTPTAA
ncbi:peptide-methionine (R)-S-oxide reductase [Cochlodiniinecator piscidefendens]|uniref:peptide-methionine (R)-S-oxide reductase n=1 Tax=Cochlodiniinecator piscidefendens TaxID=2715756 RepID=UPI0014073D72|nr:peptide-methionine (R)-S-oxide reductase [Cochlodiniinecator piscidefendens]